MKKHYKRSRGENEARTKKRLAIKKLPGEPNGNNYNKHIGFLAIRTMDEVAKIMGISKSRVHQLERYALFRIRKALKPYIGK